MNDANMGWATETSNTAEVLRWIAGRITPELTAIAAIEKPDAITPNYGPDIAVTDAIWADALDHLAEAITEKALMLHDDVCAAQSSD